MALRIAPFRPLMPAAPWVKRMHCVPYDVVNRQEAFALAHDNPFSLLHVDRAEIDLPATINPYDSKVYEQAKTNFRWLIDQGALIQPEVPLFLIYQQTMGEHTQTGIVALCEVQAYQKGLIKKHEKTRPEKVQDRAKLIDTLGAQTGPILLTYQDQKEVDALVESCKLTKPTYCVRAADGVEHILWAVKNPSPLALAFRKVKCAYIADGHHRAASAARVAQWHKKRGQKPAAGSLGAEGILSVLFPASQLQILAYNRLVLDLNGLSRATFLEEVKKSFSVSKSSSSKPDAPQRIMMYLPGQWYELQWIADPKADRVDALDVSILQDRLLNPILGIDNPRTNQRIEFIGGIHPTRLLAEKVDQAQAAVAFSMYPTTVEQMMSVANTRKTMPPKSTWFEPKLRSGFFIYEF